VPKEIAEQIGPVKVPSGEVVQTSASMVHYVLERLGYKAMPPARSRWPRRLPRYDYADPGDRLKAAREHFEAYRAQRAAALLALRAEVAAAAARVPPAPKNPARLIEIGGADKLDPTKTLVGFIIEAINEVAPGQGEQVYWRALGRSILSQKLRPPQRSNKGRSSLKRLRRTECA
jgi:hypothetical protein